MLEDKGDGNIDVIVDCPAAKAIGAIGLKEDTMPDIVVLVEDEMAKTYFTELKNKYFSLDPTKSYLDIRVLKIGAYSSIITFYNEAKNSIFYNNVYFISFMDKDVETDILQYREFTDVHINNLYDKNSHFCKFLPHTPEICLAKIFYEDKREFLKCLKNEYHNQQVDYDISDKLNFADYEKDPNINLKLEYDEWSRKRGQFRKKCKNNTYTIIQNISEQLNISIEQIYRFAFQYAVNKLDDNIIKNLMTAVFNRK